MAVFQHDPSPEPEPRDLSALFGPGQLETGIRQSIQWCWMALPANKRNLDELERQIRRITDRIFKNLREDETALTGE